MPPRGSGLRAVQALAVDDEPEPFWTGVDAAQRIASWRDAVEWTPQWGEAQLPARSLNGPSGAWVETNLLAPLGATRSDAWITDCLDTYRASTGVAAAVAGVYAPFASKIGLPAADLDPHPSETQIVNEATTSHVDRLLRELDMCQPDIVVTLGNAALRVMRHLVAEPPPLTKLTANESYGTTFIVAVGKRTTSWLPVAHPAAPRPYQIAHERWQASAATGR